MPKILNTQNTPHYQWGDACDSWIYVDRNELSIKLEKMPAGASEKKHFHHQAAQFFFVLQGTATFYLNDEKLVLREREGLTVAPQTPHYIANETALELDFLVVSQPTTNDDRELVSGDEHPHKEV
jgi:mannose-6-phosphate isomerase-like protein (cupin superfamily)